MSVIPKNAVELGSSLGFEFKYLIKHAYDSQNSSVDKLLTRF